MKLAILGTRGIPARYGGFETFAEKLSIELCERGFDVTVFCESGELTASKSFRGVRLRYINAPSLGPLRTILYDLQSLWLARKGYDVVYMLGYGAAFFCLIPRLWGTEVWINPDGLEWARSKWGPFARTYFRFMEWVSIYAANRIIADANAIAESLSSRHGRLPKCSVISYGCELIEAPPSPEFLSEMALVPGGYFLVVCRLEPENNVLEILQAFQQSRSSRQLVVVGDNSINSAYIAQLNTVRDSRIRMIGTVHDQAKLICLRFYSFAYLHGHSVGGTNPSLLEAMGCGNLVFAHDNVFNRETLGPNGLYFVGPRELTLAIDQAEQKDSQLTELKYGAKSRARANYSWSKIASEYADLLGQVSLGRRRI
jgi:glycosyltransferase involved in cell wall biosynthesis